MKQLFNFKEILKERKLTELSLIEFPNVELASEDGLLCYGAKLDTSHILSAYLQGVFPWPNQEILVPLWFSPDPRGILNLQHIKIPASLKKFKKKSPFTITFNQSFAEVMKECKKAHEQDGIWITDGMIQAYFEMYKYDLAYSVECWQEDALVGGLYGVCIGSFFTAESMFYKKSNASKLALLALMEHLHLNTKVTWIDTQMITPIVESLGGSYISRSEFMAKLAQCDFKASKNQFFP